MKTATNCCSESAKLEKLERGKLTGIVGEDQRLGSGGEIERGDSIGDGDGSKEGRQLALCLLYNEAGAAAGKNKERRR